MLLVNVSHIPEYAFVSHTRDSMSLTVGDLERISRKRSNEQQTTRVVCACVCFDPSGFPSYFVYQERLCSSQAEQHDDQNQRVTGSTCKL